MAERVAASCRRILLHRVSQSALSQSMMTLGVVMLCGELLHGAEEQKTVWAVTKLQMAARVEHTSWTLGLERLFMKELVARSVSSCSPLRKRVRARYPECWKSGMLGTTDCSHVSPKRYLES